MILRPYQQKALDEIRTLFSNGTKKVLLHLATGAGKTICFCYILKGAHAKGKSAIIVVHGRKLVDQASKRLEREGVDHGVMMAGHWRHRPALPIQVCSISTLYARRNKMSLPKAELVIIDEAHMAGSQSYAWLIKHYANSFFLPVSATPHTKAGLAHVADAVVYPTTMAKLIDDGYLVPPEYYAPSKPDLSGLKVNRQTGDYSIDELSGRMEKANLYGDMVTSYQRFASGLSALLFCVTVKHSKEVCDVFNEAGIAAEHMDASMAELKRAAIIKRLESGETKVVCNVGILTQGVDLPSLGCIMLARPTKSYNLFIQILGRGTRPFEGKTKFIVLDHANCISEHGFIERERLCQLEGTKKGEELERPPLTSCVKCFHIWDASEQWAQSYPLLVLQGIRGRDYVCNSCGHDMTPVRQEQNRAIETDSTYELKKIESIEEYENEGTLGHVIGLCKLAVSRGAKPGSVYHQLKGDPKYGARVATKYYKHIERMMKTLQG